MPPPDSKRTANTTSGLVHTPLATPYILVVDDEPDIGRLLQEILEDEGYEVRVALDGATARQAYHTQRPDLVLLDIWMPDVDGITLLKEWSAENDPAMPVIMMSGHGTVETAVEATRLGAYDFIEKPLSLAKLLITVARALEADKLARENLGLRRQSYPLNEPVGRSATFQHLKEQIKRVAPHDSCVLIQGEPGAGVRVLARYLHQCSTRHNGPYIETNVSTLSGNNAAATLFGTEQGEQIHAGLLEQAGGGTLLLYDVADMSPDIQTRLVSALERTTFERLGGHNAVHITVRLIAATHSNLVHCVEQGRFRKDLYYQLNVVPVRVPPLAEHREDVPDLLNHYVNLCVEVDALPYRSFTVAAQNRLRNYTWPGNVRELKNLVQRLLIIGAGTEIGLEEVEAALGTFEQPDQGIAATRNYDLPLREARELFEKDYLAYQLRQHDGSVVKAAQAAGLERTHLYRKLRALGIDPKCLDPD